MDTKKKKKRRVAKLLACLALAAASFISMTSEWSSFSTTTTRRILTEQEEEEERGTVRTNPYDIKFQLVLPSDQPDPEPQAILDELFLQDQTPFKALVDRPSFSGGKCWATSQVRIAFDPQRSDGPVILKSYTFDGDPKTNGGDEYYITYSMPENEKGYPDAVAYSKDLGDGTYELHFVQPLLPGPDSKARPAAISGGGTVSVILQYTCGIGGLMPPTKSGWSTTGGAVNRRWTATVDTSVVPPVVMARDRSMPEQFGFAFSNYKNTFAVGDSLLAQFVGGRTSEERQRQTNMSFDDYMQSSLKTATLNYFLVRVRLLLQENDIYGNKGSNSALILNSGVWDILDNNKWQPNFDDHLEAVKQYIQAVQEMTDAQIYWKSMTAMHTNIVTNPLGFDRVRYMSSTRAKSINDAQVELMRDLNIPVLAMYNMTYEAQEHMRPGDGRHYTIFFNDLLMDYFYPTNEFLSNVAV